MRESMEFLRFLILCGFLFSSTRIMATTTPNTITVDQSIRDGETVVSAGGVFEQGFFSPGTSRSRYLGIWYKRVAPLTVVWVANRETPISDSSGVLRINARGILVLLNSTNDVVWSSNSSRTPQNPVAELLISGNLVVKDGNDNNPENYLWQSFDYPGDTMLPDMKIGKNLVTGHEWFVSSWKSANDPSKGDYTMGIDPRGSPQLMIKRGSVILIRPGPWNGFHWSGAPTVRSTSVYSYNLVSNEKEVIFTYSIHSSSILVRLTMNQSGATQRFTWTDQSRTWAAFFAKRVDECDNYGHCGVNAICNINNFPTCQCLKGFVPKSPGQWNVYNWSAGCVRNASLDREGGDGFLRLGEVTLPDTSHSRAVKYISLEECEKLCLKDCSCTAYATLDLRDGGSGCLLWFTDLIDIKNTQGGQDLFVRSVASELDEAEIRRQRNGTNHMIIIVTTTVTGTSGVASLLLVWFLCKRTKNLKNDDDNCQEDIGISMYDLKTSTNATDNFADENKLGEGGFGHVYKGVLIEG